MLVSKDFDIYLREHELTSRVKGLKKAYFRAMPEVCIERANLITKYCKKNNLFGKERVSILEKAKLYRYVLENRSTCVRHNQGYERSDPGEEMQPFSFLDSSLFIGSTTSKFKGVPLYPEFLSLAIWPELWSISTRTKNPYQLDEQDAKTLNEEVYPLWMEENILERTRKRCKVNGEDPLGIRLLQHLVFFMASKNNCISHTIPDFSRVVQEGLERLIQEADEKRNINSQPDTKEFYAAIVEGLKGIVAYSHNLAKSAEKLARKEDHPVRKQELIELAEIHRHVPAHPARTFREGLTAIWICWIAIHLENPNLAISLGRLDQVMYDLYAKDIDGTLTIDEAIELICCLWLKMGDHVPLIPNAGEQLFGGTGSNQAVTIGGVVADDSETPKDAVNELTYIILRATELMMLRDPNLNARYYPDVNSDEYIKRLCDANIKTKATPALHNDKAVIKALMGQGDTLAQARNYGIIGCVEPVSAGRSYTASSSILLNLTAILELTLFDGHHRHTGLDRLISIATGDPASIPSSIRTFEHFKEAFSKQLEWMVNVTTELNDSLGVTHQLVHPTPILSSLFKGPMQKGKDLIQGGAEINGSGVTIIGFADTVDSLTAIDHAVFRGKKFSFAELNQALECDFKGQGALHKTLAGAPKYGNDDGLAGGNALWLAKTIHDTFQAKINYRGGKYRVGYWTMTNHAGYGRLVGALPSGRRARENLASGITPVSNVSSSLTAALNSVASLPAEWVPGGMALNIKYTPERDKKTMLDNFTASVKGYFDDRKGKRDGGMEIQFNINDRQAFVDAVHDPDPELLVRVSGYTAYFKDLNPAMQKEIIDRTEYDLTTGKMVSYSPFKLPDEPAKIDLSWLEMIPGTGKSADKILEILLKGMDISFWFSRGYRKNIKNFKGRYLFLTKNRVVACGAIFDDGKMNIQSDVISDWDVCVSFSDQAALLEFLLSEDQDVLNSLLEDEVEIKGNVNYVYRLAYLARDLKHRILGR